VTTRITFTDPYVWQRTEAAFAQQLAEESDYLYAASQLLLDVWLWITGCHSSVNESPFLILAKLTRQIDFPPSHIAHCIRDIAYGDKPRVKDLEAMIHSKDPAYRTIFVEACWVDIEELQVKKQREKKRRR